MHAHDPFYLWDVEPPNAESRVMKDKRSIKREILAQFKDAIGQDRDSLPIYWPEGHYISGLSRNERKLLAQAVFELIQVGLVRWGDGAFSRTLRLTRKGQHLLW